MSPQVLGVSEEHLVPDEVRALMPDLLHQLRQTLHPRWQELHEMPMVDEVEHFVEQLQQLAQAYPHPALKEYANTLYKYVRNYQVEEMETTLSAFPTLLQQLSEVTP